MFFKDRSTRPPRARVGNLRPTGHMRPAQVLNVTRVRTLLSVQQTGRIKNVKIS